MEPSAAAPVEPTDPAAIVRGAVIGDRVTIEQAADALGVTERSVYNAIDRYSIPYVVIFRRRYISPDALRAALVREVNRQPRRPGRPRKAA